MKVDQLMKAEVYTCRPGETLNRAAELMWDHDCGCVPVVDGDGKAIAMLTDRDVCMAAYTQGKALRDMTVASAMSRNLVACALGSTLAEAEDLLQTHKVRRLPVVDADGRLIGLLSLNDLAQQAARERGLKRKTVSDAEIGETLAAVCEPRLSCDIAPAAGQPAAA